MGIATIKAALVMSIFMHMLHDKKFNLLVFLSSFIFAALFIGFTLMDSQEYNEEVKEYDYTVIKNELELKK
jgi:cytochrome c oxidase subunit 4